MPPERIEEIRQAAQRAGDCNGWTGTTGQLARFIMELLGELKYEPKETTDRQEQLF